MSGSSLQDRHAPVAPVTGGDSGIGRAVAAKMAHQGMDAAGSHVTSDDWRHP
ncbi:hypothetical protein [Streptomyces sp. NPDC002785]|uniref:hypothetical protein n=1 Tax=Streptomyces sp. NPDC002785 TaxID=3154543 RepID=UPI0033296BBF